MKSTVKDSFNIQACYRAQEVLPMKCFFYKLIPSSQKTPGYIADKKIVYLACKPQGCYLLKTTK